jgi:hypothetical protein
MGCGTNKIEETQIGIIQEIVSNRKDFSEREAGMSIALQNSNTGTIQVIENLKEAPTEEALDTLKMLYGIESNFIKISPEKKFLFNQIFKDKEYTFLLKQNSEKSRWSPQIVDYLQKNNNLIFKNKKYEIYLSKPIFTSNGEYALVGIHANTWTGIGIYQKIDDEWEEAGLIAVYLVSPKIPFIKTEEQ